VQSDPGTWSADDRAARAIVALPTTAEDQEAALTASTRISDALGPELLGAFLAVRRSDAASAAHRELDSVLADLRWRY
jgi:glutamine synthetase